MMNGSGVAIDPYLIYSVADIEALRDTVNSGDAKEQKLYIQLKADLVLPDRNWIPIGTDTYPFRGHFDGEGHTFTHLKIEQSMKDYLGVFGVVETSLIKNMGVVDCMIRGRQYVGGIVGKISANSIVEKCYVLGEIIASGNYVGGIAGYSDYYNKINRCYTNVSINGQGKNVGGIVGYGSYKSTIEHCYSRGSVRSQSDCVGGISGYNGSSCSIRSCYTISTVGGASYVGGVVGKSESYEELGTIENCIVLSEAVGGKVSGRIIGNVSEIGTNNYAYKGLLLNDEQVLIGELDNQNGEDLTRQQINKESTYLTKEFNYQNGWILREGKLPRLVGVKGQKDELPEHLLMPKTISMVTMDVMPPIVGTVPPKEMNIETNMYHVEQISWEPKHTQFEADTVYELSMTLQARRGFEFGEVVANLPSSQSINVETPSNQGCDKIILRAKFPRTELPRQEGMPQLEAGNVVRVGETISVGEGTLKITEDISYRWYRTKVRESDVKKAQFIGEMKEYTPIVEDIGHYLMVVAQSSQAVGEAYVMTQQIAKYSYEGEIIKPSLQKVSQDSISLNAQAGYEYAIAKKGEEGSIHFTEHNEFLYLMPDTEYDLHQRRAATATHEASKSDKISVTTAKIFIHTFYSTLVLPESAVVVGSVVKKPEEVCIKTNVDGLELVPKWQVFDENNNPIALDGTVVGKSNEIYIFKAVIQVPSSKYCFNPQLEKMSGVKVSVDGEQLTQTFILSTTAQRKGESFVTTLEEPKEPENKSDKNWKEELKDVSEKDIMRPTSNLGPNHMGVWNLHVRS
ncbi:MAG: GLUG motif-containing protein [Cellulosilyticaceae bacterium]